MAHCVALKGGLDGTYYVLLLVGFAVGGAARGCYTVNCSILFMQCLRPKASMNVSLQGTCRPLS